ncbi:hypothetical protein TNCV_4089091 [Trichonephila clavipes]|nr:hypothetical protein TNCV_4089091 [Trichonephila clavipes]
MMHLSRGTAIRNCADVYDVRLYVCRKCGMHYMYGRANGKRQSYERLRYECITCSFQTRSFHVTRHDAGRRRAVTSSSLEESLLNVVTDRPESSTRAVAHHNVLENVQKCQEELKNSLKLKINRVEEKITLKVEEKITVVEEKIEEKVEEEIEWIKEQVEEKNMKWLEI